MLREVVLVALALLPAADSGVRSCFHTFCTSGTAFFSTGKPDTRACGFEASNFSAPDVQNAAKQDLTPLSADRSVINGARFGTASISGVVLSADSGRPLRAVRISAASSDVGVRPLMATTDENGRFTLSDLPAGRYFLSASKDGFITVHYGQRRPMGLGRAVDVLDAERVRNVDFRLPRGSAITGRVVDADGEPIVFAAVLAWQRVVVRGEVRVRQVATAATDDRGIFRLHGLTPGSYYVSASLQLSDFDVRFIRRNEDGSPKAFGPMEPDFSSPGIAYAPAYFPAAGGLSEAVPITLALSQEVAGVDIVLPTVNAAQVTGIVPGVGATDRNAQVFLAREDGQRTPTLTGRTDESGRFSISHVAPGRYLAVAYVFSGQMGDPPMAGIQALNVPAGAVVGVSIAVQPRTTIPGSVSFDGTTNPTQADVRKIQIALLPVGRSMDIPAVSGYLTGSPRPDATFSLSDFVLDGEYGASVTAIPQPWTVKAIYLDGRDVTDATFDLRQGEQHRLNVVLTDKCSELSGTVRDGRDRLAADVTVIAFPADAQMWRPTSQRIQAVRTDKDGAYSIRGLPPGEYLLAATDDARQDEWYDVVFLDALRKNADRVMLRDGEKKSRHLIQRN